MNTSSHFVVFMLDEQQYALHLEAVERIVRAVDITPLPKTPESVLGVVNVRGRIVPIFNIRRRFRLPERELDLSDQLIIAHTSRRAVALVADSVTQVLELPEGEVLTAEAILVGLGYVEGVARLAEGILLIHNLDRFLSLEEGKALDEAML